MNTGEFSDSHGAPLSGPNAALDGINDFVEGFVAYQPRAVNVLETADAFEDSALANIYAGILWMFLERPEAPLRSAPYSRRAAFCTSLHPREQALLATLEAWQRYDFKAVRRILDDLLARWPHDLASLKLAQYHAFNAGDAKAMLQLASATRKANELRAPWHSMLAFGHEQLHEIDAAERAAMRALELDEDEPWAHHALAHVHLSRGTTREGCAFLLEHADAWAGLNSFMFTHNWWHVALFEMASGDVDAALRIYDERCWGVEPEYSQDQIGAISLLARIECASVDVGDRWQRLLPYLRSRDTDVIQPFLTLQYLYGLSRAGAAEARVLLHRIKQQAEAPEVLQDRQLWIEVGIPAAVGLHAQATGDHEIAARELARVRGQLWRVGGSHAQRDLFEQVLLDARLKSGDWPAARAMLQQRQRYEPHNPSITTRLAGSDPGK